MYNKKILDETIENIYQALLNLTDAKELLSQSKVTKKYYDEKQELDRAYMENLNMEESNKYFDISVNYEKSLAMMAFLNGYQQGYQKGKLLDDKDFLKLIAEKLNI